MVTLGAVWKVWVGVYRQMLRLNQLSQKLFIRKTHAEISTSLNSASITNGWSVLRLNKTTATAPSDNGRAHTSVNCLKSWKEDEYKGPVGNFAVQYFLWEPPTWNTLYPIFPATSWFTSITSLQTNTTQIENIKILWEITLKRICGCQHCTKLVALPYVCTKPGKWQLLG